MNDVSLRAFLRDGFLVFVQCWSFHLIENFILNPPDLMQSFMPQTKRLETLGDDTETKPSSFPTDCLISLF